MASRSSNAYQQRINATNAGEEGRDYVADFLAATAQSNPRGALGVATHPFPQGTYSDVHGFNQQVRCTTGQHSNGGITTRTLMHTEMTRLAYAMRNVRRLDYAMHSSKPTKRARAMRGSLRTKRKQKLCDMTIRYCACMWICICNFANAFICNFVALIANGPLLSRALVSLHTCYTIAHGTRQKMWTYGATPRCGRRARTHRTSTPFSFDDGSTPNGAPTRSPCTITGNANGLNDGIPKSWYAKHDAGRLWTTVHVWRTGGTHRTN